MKGKYMPISYNWLQSFFQSPLPSPNDLANVITNGTFEIEEIVQEGDDWALDVKVLPDRAADAFSHRGIAREVSVLTGNAFADPFATDFPTLTPHDDSVTLRVHTQGCTAHALARIEGVTVGPSPDWLKRRIEAIGQRSINNIVDATNYVLFELGQPVHVFDWDKFAEKDGARGITVRDAHKNETLTVLGGKEVALPQSAMVLADAHSDVALDIAGIKGGVAAELTEETKNVLVTAAHFDPVRIRKTAQAVAIRTDASKRFENGLPEPLVAYGMARTVKLITDIAKGTCTGFATHGIAAPTERTLSVSAAIINSLLGTDILPDAMATLLRVQGFTVIEAGDALTLTIPFERLDVQEIQDVAEEVARVYGYNNITDVPLPPQNPAVADITFTAAEAVRAVLSARACTEVLTYTLTHTGKVQLSNAFAADKDTLRTALTPGVTEALDKNERNAPLLGEDTAVRLFEIGSVFLLNETEELRMCIGVRMLAGKKRVERANEEVALHIAALQEALGVTITCAIENGIVECMLPVAKKEVQQAPYIAAVAYTPFSLYPFVLRDIAVWVPEKVHAAEVLDTIRAHAGDLLVRADLFDTFTKEGRTSYAFHLVFQAKDRTLTDVEVGEHMEKVENALRAKGYEVR